MKSSPQADQESDQALLRRLRNGEVRAAEQVVDRLGPVIRRVVFRLTGWHDEIDDLVNDVFLAIQSSGHRFRQESTLETWATAVSIRICRKWIRSRQIRRVVRGSMESLLDQKCTDNREQDIADLQEEMRRALGGLSHADRELIVLRYLEEYELNQMVELLGIRRGTLEVRLHRAKRRLAALLEESSLGDERRAAYE